MLDAILKPPPVADVAASRDSPLAGGHDAIQELDVRPLAAFPDRVAALDARFRISW